MNSRLSMPAVSASTSLMMIGGGKTTVPVVPGVGAVKVLSQVIVMSSLVSSSPVKPLGPASSKPVSMAMRLVEKPKPGSPACCGMV